MARSEIAECWLCNGGNLTEHHTDGICNLCDNTGRQVITRDVLGGFKASRPATKHDLTGDDYG